MKKLTLKIKNLTQNLWFNIAYILILTFFGLWLALYDSYEEVLVTISNVPIWKLLLIIIWGLLPFIVWGYMFTLMAQHIHPKYKFKQGLAVAFIGGFMAGMTPSSTGGQFAQTTTFKRQGLTSQQGAGLVWMDFYIYTITFVGLSILLFLLRFDSLGHSSITFIFALGLLLNIAIIVVLWLMVEYPDLYRKMSNWFIHLISQLKFVKNKEKATQSWNESMDHFHEAMSAINDNKSMLGKLFGLDALRLLLYYATPFVVGELLGISLKWADLLTIMALASFVAIANSFVPLPGASGATESVFVLSFSVLIGKAAAASTMILWRFSTFYMIMLIGGYLYLHSKHTHLIRRHKDRKKEKFNEEDIV